MNGRVAGPLGAKTDNRIVELFVASELSRERREKFTVTALPDHADRQREAVEAIATGESGTTVAIEHTLLQDFPNERHDAARFRRAIAPLETDPSIVVDNADLLIWVEPFSIPDGADWNAIPAAISAHLAGIRAELPLGWSHHLVACGRVQLNVAVQLLSAPGMPGAVFVGRLWPQIPVTDSVAIALKRKLPKLVAQAADARMLLLERLMIPMQFAPQRLGQAVEALRAEYPNLEQIDEIWLAYSGAWERENVVWYRRGWQRRIAAEDAAIVEANEF